MADLGDKTPNVSIVSNDNTKTVTTTTDGGNERLDVSSKNINGAGANAVNIQDGGNSITVDGTVELGATSLAALESITVQNGSGASAVNIQDGGNSITIDATSLPLPTGAATSALQTTGNTSLSNIDGKLPTTLGQKLMANSLAVVLSSDQSVIPISDNGGSLTVDGTVELGATSLAALESITVQNGAGASAVNIQDGGNSITIDAVSLPLPTGAATSAKQDTGNTSVASIDTKTPTIGQKTMANSSPIVIASDQSAIPVTDNGGSLTVDGTVELGATSLAALESITVQNGAGANAVNIQDGGNSITIDATSLPLPTGASTSANQATEIASLSSIDGKLNSLGQKAMAASVPVVISSDQSNVPADIKSQINVVSAVNSSTSNLAAAAVFTGTGVSSLSVDSIQINFKASHICTIQCQQSIDDTNWDIIDSYTVSANTGDARVFTPTASYVRVVVTNIDSATTTFLRLQTVLCPISSTLPRSLSQNGYLKVSVQESIEATNAYQGNIFSAATTQTNGNTNELAFFLFRNPSGNTKDAILNKLILDIATKGQSVTFKVYHTPTITSVGTTVTPRPRLIKGTLGTSSMLTYVTPTISANGTLLSIFSGGKDSNSFVENISGALILGPGKDLLVTAQVTSNGNIPVITLEWSEQ